MRGRNWVVASVLIVGVIAAARLAGHPKPRRSGPRPVVAFGARVEQIPSTAILRFTNGWVASSGLKLVGVYAGAQSIHPANGLLVIARFSGAHQRLQSIVLHGTGAATLLKPSPPPDEDAAAHEMLRFVTANGATGSLRVGTGKVSLHG
ncbi:MAG TPA: hypothetical protein VHV75_02460 [Solirubrobacteraceae bacterium]|jgi:hypothetical protein|nr:hypothetical protein [Solirubrobacteraceae bacterium]